MERIRQRLSEDPELFPVHATKTRAKSPTVDRYGSIDGVKLFQTWKTREECANAGVHRALVAGIRDGPSGAYSICMSGAYEDQDDGETVLYTGTGGFGSDKGAGFGSVGKQVEDQTFQNRMNKSLRHSATTGRPVRVVRGPNPLSKYAPERDYRYDGLYKVVKAYYGKTEDEEFLVCRFELERLEDQRAIPEKPGWKPPKKRTQSPPEKI